MYVDLNSLDEIEFSLLRGINKIILYIRRFSNDGIEFKQTDIFECIDLVITPKGINHIEEILKKIRPTNILRIRCSILY